MSLSITVPQIVNAVLTTKTTPPSPVPNEPFTFKHRATGATDWVNDASATTDPTGTATITVPALNVGTAYDYEADFVGDIPKGFSASFGQALNQVVMVGTTVTVSTKSP